MVLLQILIYAAQIVRLKEISWEKLTKFWKIVSISVSSHINAHLLQEPVKLFGKPLVNFKLMLSSIVQNSVVISASEMSSNIWLELNFKSTSVSNAQKFYWCVNVATKNIQELTSTTISA